MKEYNIGMNVHKDQVFMAVLDSRRVKRGEAKGIHEPGRGEEAVKRRRVRFSFAVGFTTQEPVYSLRGGGSALNLTRGNFKQGKSASSGSVRSP
jgi:hypothetical protein